MFDIGKPLPEELRNALKDMTDFPDWAVVCRAEGKVSPYNIRDILRGCNVYENSFSTVENLIRFTILKSDESISKIEKNKSILNTYNRLKQITA